MAGVSGTRTVTDPAAWGRAVPPFPRGLCAWAMLHT